MYLRTPFLKQLWQDFRTVGKMQDPAAARLVFVTVVALGAEGFAEIEWVAQSMIGQWIYVVFAVDTQSYAIGQQHQYLWNLEVLTNVTVQVSFFLRCVVLEIQMFMIPALQKLSFR